MFIAHKIPNPSLPAYPLACDVPCPEVKRDLSSASIRKTNRQEKCKYNRENNDLRWMLLIDRGSSGHYCRRFTDRCRPHLEVAMLRRPPSPCGKPSGAPRRLVQLEVPMLEQQRIPTTC